MLVTNPTRAKPGRVGKAYSVMDKFLNRAEPVSFGAKLANSQVFADLFRDGMALVEETATYLDGPLIDRSQALQLKVRRLDATIHNRTVESPPLNPVERQLGLLKAAFGAESV
jgi:hypothetical protein